MSAVIAPTVDTAAEEMLHLIQAVESAKAMLDSLRDMHWQQLQAGTEERRLHFVRRIQQKRLILALACVQVLVITEEP